jgi:hypothetical protein
MKMCWVMVLSSQLLVSSAWGEEATQNGFNSLFNANRTLSPLDYVDELLDERFPLTREAPKKYVSIGMFDHKTGTSLVGFSRTLAIHDEHEFFIGVGTLIAMNTLSLGWKHIWLEARNFDAYAVLSIHVIAAMSENLLITPFMSVGIEKEVSDPWFLQLGLNNTLRVYGDGRSSDLLMYPNVNLSYRY